MTKQITKKELRENILQYIEATNDFKLEDLGLDNDPRYLKLQTKLWKKEEKKRGVKNDKIVAKIKKLKPKVELTVSWIQVHFGLGYADASSFYYAVTGKRKTTGLNIFDNEVVDDKLDEARKYVIKNKDFTISGIQVNLGTGYARSAKLLEALMKEKSIKDLQKESKKENEKYFKVYLKQSLEYFPIYKKSNKFFDYAEFFEKLGVLPKFRQPVFEELEKRRLVSTNDFVFRIK